jgi:polar amino acid transport system permease protein
VYDFNIELLFPYVIPIAKGFWKTILLSAGSSVICIFVVLIFLLARLAVSKRYRNIFTYATNIFVDVVQSIPVLVALVWFYFGFPNFGINLSPDVCAIIVLGISFSAFALDLIFSAESNIRSEAIFAAQIHGMSKFNVFRWVMFPAIWQSVKDPLAGQVITVVKLSTLASIVGSQEILSVSNGIISSTYRPLETYTIVALFFILTIAPVNYLRRLSDKSASRYKEMS